MIESAIVSVSDKSNLEELMEGLFQINPEIEIFSSGGTAIKIRDLGFDVTEVSTYTGFPEAPGGLVKTLHPKVHGGILLDPARMSEKEYLDENNIKTFNLVVVNLYPFEKTLAGGGSREEIVENIDIGGPTLIRSAAKGALRHGRVVPVVSPDDYDDIVRELERNEGSLSKKSKVRLAHKAFDHTWNYDEKIRNWTEELMEAS